MLDTTQLSTYARCPRLYKYKFIDQIRKSTVDEGEQTRNFGQCVHKALELWQKERDLGKGIQWFKNNYTALDEENIRTTANGVTLLEAYVELEAKNFPGATTCGIEIVDTYTIGSIQYTIKIDRVIEYNSNTYVIDYKTTTSKTHYYFMQFSPNFAVSAYCNYCVKKFGKCSGFIPIAMQMGYRKNKYMGEPAGFWCKFDYDIVNRNKEELQDFECQVGMWHERITNGTTYPRNEGACMDFKRCGYAELCISCDDESVRENLYAHYDAYSYLTSEQEVTQ